MILTYLKYMLQEILPLIPVVVLLRVALFFYHKKKGLRTTVPHEAGIVCFLLYLWGLASQTVSLDFLFRGDFKLRGSINWVPFQGIQQIWNSGESMYVLVNVLGNIVMFMPIGFLIPLLWKRCETFHWTMLCGFFASLLIETLQLFSIRATDVDDLILNTLGACSGWLVFAILNRLFPRLIQCFRGQRVLEPAVSV